MRSLRVNNSIKSNRFTVFNNWMYSQICNTLYKCFSDWWSDDKTCLNWGRTTKLHRTIENRLWFQFVISAIPHQCMIFFSRILYKVKHAYITTRIVSKLKSIFLGSIPHLAFSLPKTHSIGFLEEILVILVIKATSFLF